jgi:predicted deacylase
VADALVHDFDPAEIPRGTVARVQVAFAPLPDGGSARFPLIVIAGLRPGPTLMCVGGIHGDEFEGPSALWRLASWLTPDRLAGQVWIVPVANTAAFSAGLRVSPVDGQNLARIFPGDANGTVSYRLAHALFALACRADMLVDCHSGGVRLAFLPVAGFYGSDPSLPDGVVSRSLQLAKSMALPHLWRLPPRAGVLSFEAMRCGVAATGCEVGGRGGLLPEDSDRYLHGIQRLLAAERMIDAAVATQALHYETCFEGDWELAPDAGFIENHVALGERVAAGTRLASILSPLGDTITALTAGTQGVVMGVRHLRSIHVGEWATCVVREAAL